MDILLWLTDRPAYRLIKKLRWEMEIMDLADKMNKMEEKTDIEIKLFKLTELTSGMFLILEQSDGAMCAYISGKLSALSDYAKFLSDIKMKKESPMIPEVQFDEPQSR